MPFPPVHPTLKAALDERGFAEPTPVQAAVLEPTAAGHDLLVSAQTGSGKTVAYGLAIAASLMEGEPRPKTAKEPAALVVAPTRELALQVHRELTWLLSKARLSVVSCVGGVDIRREARDLSRGADVVVGTPGRLCDHLERGRLVVSSLRVLVLDEADEMLDLGFREELEKLLDATPAERRTLLFSATLPRAIVALAKRYQRDAHRIDLAAEDEPHGDIEYRALPVAPYEREHAVVNVLRYHDARGALVFCSTREAVKHLHANLVERGFAAVALSGELSQPERTRALQALRDGRARLCVATDVAARGLDLPDLGLVIHFDVPTDRQMLLHRSGRTGRAGKKGACVLLVPFARRHAVERLLESASIRANWSAPPSADQVRERDQERLLLEIAKLSEDPAADDLAMAKLLLAQLTPEQLAAALVRLQRGMLPAPEDIVLDTPKPAAAGRPKRAWIPPHARPGPPERRTRR